MQDIESLYHSYRIEYYSYLLRLTGNQTASEDLLHDAFIKMSEKLGTLKDDTKFRSWGYSIISNTFRDWYKKNKKTVFLEKEIIEAVPAQSANPSGMEDLMRKIINTLEPETREVFVLSHFEELTYDEIADTLNTSERTVRRRMEIAVNILERMLVSANVIRGGHFSFEGIS